MSSVAAETVPQTPEPVDELKDLPQSVPGRMGSSITNRIKALFGMPWERKLARGALMVSSIRYWEEQYRKLNNVELKQIASKLKGRARGGQALEKLLPEAFGLVCVACQRTIGMRPFDVQLAGGVAMHFGALAELATGEGKTLTAALPAFLNALLGKGVHVATVNDYLAKRDAEWIGPAYELLGLTIGILQQQMPEPQRIEQYRRDITYGMASEFGFDFLRDQ